MSGFQVVSQNNEVIRFQYYQNEAPESVKAFAAQLPFERAFIHARVSGQEIWTDDAPDFNVIQENASVFTEPGEVVLGPTKPERVKTRKCVGIYYGEGKGLDCANIFAKVHPEDIPQLTLLGNNIWKKGEQLLRFEALLE
jgi:hypothetical protein